MTRVTTVELTNASERLTEAQRAGLAAALESGQVLFLPHLAFPLESLSAVLAAATSAAMAKNVSYDPATGRLGGVRPAPEGDALLRATLAAFADFGRRVLLELLPHYASGLVLGRTSFRPAEIEGRVTSWRKDDTRLHVDSFPATPVQGKRILRFFANVNPDDKPRSWRLGEPFRDVAARFLPGLRSPLPGASLLLEALHVTKTRRTAYDSYMLQMHDAMKADLDYQARADQAYFGFPAGTCWLVYTDLVSHAAMSGQHAFEQTFYLPVKHMEDPERSPLRTLERMTGKALV
jgi:hypothetical protein